MLVRDAGGILTRMHSAYISDSDVETIVAQIKAQRVVEYTVYEKVDDQSGIDEQDVVLYQAVVEYLRSLSHVSVSQVQRQFRIGYNRASRMIDLLEKQGLSPVARSKMRRVVHALLDQWALTIMLNKADSP